MIISCLFVRGAGHFEIMMFVSIPSKYVVFFHLAIIDAIVPPLAATKRSCGVTWCKVEGRRSIESCGPFLGHFLSSLLGVYNGQVVPACDAHGGQPGHGRTTTSNDPACASSCQNCRVDESWTEGAENLGGIDQIFV